MQAPGCGAGPIEYRAIGVLRTPFERVEGMPIQPIGARGVRGFAAIEPQYQLGLKDLSGFSHLILLYHLHQAAPGELLIRPFLDGAEARGVFATRAPRRPNPIGFSVVKLVAVRDDGLEIEEVDMLDGTPLLDIKPYVPAFDARATDRIGWLAGRAEAAREVRADGRFSHDDPGLTTR